jgi:hypothetical protein
MRCDTSKKRKSAYWASNPLPSSDRREEPRERREGREEMEVEMEDAPSEAALFP